MSILELEKRLELSSLNSADVAEVVNFVSLNEKAFTFSNIPLTDLEVFAIFKNTGGVKIFKCIRGFIVEDKLDTSYTESRELIGLSTWNIKKAIRVRFNTEGELHITSLTILELHAILFSVIKPEALKYVIGVEEDCHLTIISVDKNLLKGVSYKELKDCVNDSYRRQIKRMVEHNELSYKNPTFYCVVDFSEED